MEKFQTLLPRLLARLLDMILLSPLAIVDDSIRNTAFPDQTKIALLTAFSLANITYFIIMHWQFGQTVGKMLMKVKVLDVSEEPLKFRKAFCAICRTSYLSSAHCFS